MSIKSFVAGVVGMLVLAIDARAHAQCNPSGHVTAKLWGAAGGAPLNCLGGASNYGPAGGYVNVDLGNLPAGVTLYIVVGQGGSLNGSADATANGAFGGGGRCTGDGSASGGGASHISLSLAPTKSTMQNIIAVAGGAAGGSSEQGLPNFGCGGGLVGATGFTNFGSPATGGTQTAGGNPGTGGYGGGGGSGTSGSFLQGGNGMSCKGSGGGGGIYGGGGGNGDCGACRGGPGGGGSSFINPNFVLQIRHNDQGQGRFIDANGSADPDWANGAGNGAIGGGNHGRVVILVDDSKYEFGYTGTVQTLVLPCPDSDADGVLNSLDNCPSVSNPSQADCDQNGIGDACQAGNTDCNSNSVPDYCDITSGTSADADSNGIPDSCQPDCNLNNLPDAWEIATGRATDYNADGIPDTCQGAVMVDTTTDNLGAPSGLATREHSFTALPFAESAVTITIDLIGDLNRVNEYVDVSLNGGTPRRFFEADGNDCPATPDRAIITLTRAEFNALLSPNGGTGAILVVSMTGSPGVDSSECKNAALTQFHLQYVGIQAKSGDCNGNNRLDIAETHDGTTPDCNLNTVPDSCDIARGAAQDCNLNGVPDSCELATTPALDCNTNGIIDSCDLATGGTTVDCDQNGRIDSCQVTETPGTDCNGNLRPDACDIASGASGDIDHNGTPDECQTVNVPGQYAGIQAAIDAAPASEMRIISVAAGTYAGPIAFNGKPVIVRGASAASTVIDGASGQTLSVVRFNGGEPAIAALERVTVRGGITGTPIPSSPTVLAGGGIFGLDSAASVRDCVVEQNASGFGAGAYFLRCTGEVRGCTFRNNNASSDGGGFQSNQGTQQLTDVLIENNVCNSRGAGMHLVQGTPTLTRVTVRNNYSNNLIGGVSWYALGDATAAAMLDACVVTGNSALVTQGGIGISAASTGVPTFSLRASNVCNNTPRPNISGAWLDLGGNTICDCVGDLTLDGLVNGADLGILLAGWGACTGSCASDLNRDGVVNGADLGVLLAAWGACGG